MAGRGGASDVPTDELRGKGRVYGGMKTKSDDRNQPEKRNQKPTTGQPESAESRETFAQREKRPGQVGLANEARPGLGTRAEDELVRNDPAENREMIDKPLTKDSGKPKATPYGYSEPLPAPREQDPNTLATELERQTGASGQMGNG